MDIVSIIIPAFNGERFLQNCISSALSQSYLNLEVIVIDDGSTDGTSNLAKKKMSVDSRVKYFRIDNSGVSAARKTGIDKALGKWVCFLDVDDMLPKKAIETFSMHFHEHPDIIASGEPDLSLEEYRCGLMRRKSHPELWGKIFKTDFIRKYYPSLDRSIKIGEDQIINLFLANNATKLVTISKLQYCYNLDNPDSVTRRFRRTSEYEIKFEDLFNTLVRPGFDSSSKALKYSEYKMKIEGFKMVVLDGNRFDPKCREWKEIVEYFAGHPYQLASSEGLLIKLEQYQWIFCAIMKLWLSRTKLIEQNI